MTDLAVIAAVDENWGMAKDGKIPWNCPDDLKLFRKLTDGCPIIFGRKTWDSIGKSLPNRFTIVVSGDAKYKPTIRPDAVVSDLNTALLKADLFADNNNSPTVFFGGGAEIYKQVFTRFYINTVYISQIKGNYDSDLKFPVENLIKFDWAVNETEGKGFNFKIYKALSRRESEIADGIE